jgi:hypothetical protein
VTAVETQVRTVRARLRRAAGLGAAVRWALYGALLAGGWLVAAKLAGLPRGPLWIAAALPLVAGAAAMARRLDLRQAGAAIDRALGLEERVVTALEGPSGPFGSAVATDAVRSIDPARIADVGRFRWPTEARFLVPAAALVAILAALPDSPRSRARTDAEWRTALEPALDRLVRVRISDPELAAKVKSIHADLASDDLQKVAVGSEAARRLAVEIRAGLSKAGGDRESLRTLADRLEAAGSGASSQLARHGIEVPEVAPVDLETRIAEAKARGDLGVSGSRPEDRPVSALPGGDWITVQDRQTIERRLEAKPVDRRYDAVVRRYYDRLVSNSR